MSPPTISMRGLLGGRTPTVMAAGIRSRPARRRQLPPAPAHAGGGGSGGPALAGAEAPVSAAPPAAPAAAPAGGGTAVARVKARAAARRREQVTYQLAAVAASLGVGALAVAGTYYRFAMHAGDGELPWADMACTLALVCGGAVGMELWARYAHKALWHDFAPGWALHKSHHAPRLGPFEANDVFALMNAVPATALCLYGYLTPSLAGSLCFGGGLGITLFGISYMFVHDGLVHRRFPVGPLAELPAMKRIVAAHKLHHTELYGGVPWGLFLGPQELEAIGAGFALDRLVADAAGATGDAAGAAAAAAAQPEAASRAAAAARAGDE